jgi:CBS domain-containing protein
VSFHLNLNTETISHCDLAPPRCLEPTASVRAALELMQKHNAGTVLVCQNNRVVGIFTERDALKMMAAGANFDGPLEKSMTPNPVVLHGGDIVSKAITLMAQGGYRRLPIVDEQQRPIGIITVQGILHYLVDHFPTVIYNLPPEPHHLAVRGREGA